MSRMITVNVPTTGRPPARYGSIFETELEREYMPAHTRRIEVFGAPEQLSDRELAVFIETALEAGFGAQLPLSWPRVQALLEQRRLASFDFEEARE